MSNLRVARRFVEKINAHDVDGVVSLMTANHVFVDSLGNRSGRPDIEDGWRAYFAMVPDYWIKITEEVIVENAVIIFGTAGGTYVPSGGAKKTENEWETPAVWRAAVRAGKVSEWRIWADNEPIRLKMRSINQ